MLHKETILLEHIITEKATENTSLANQYTFKVGSDANRVAIKQAVEDHYGVNVASVKVMNAKPKYKNDRMRRGRVVKRSSYKKAIIRLAEGDTIELA